MFNVWKLRKRYILLMDFEINFLKKYKWRNIIFKFIEIEFLHFSLKKNIKKIILLPKNLIHPSQIKSK